MVFHETIEAQQKANQLNKEFENKTGEGYQKAKETKMGLYGSFEAKEYDPNKVILDTEIPDMSDTGVENITIPEINKAKNEKIESNPIFPIVSRLNRVGEISEDTINKILEYLSENKKLDLDKIEGIKPEERKVIEGYKVNLNEQNKNGNRLNLIKNIKDIEILKGEKTNDNGTFESEILNLIGGNYLQFPNKEGTFDTKEDLKTAISTTKNEILKNYTNFSRKSESYNTAMKNIKSKDISKQMQGIELLYILATSKPGELQSNINKYRIKNKEKVEKEAKNKKMELEEKIQNENNPEKKEQIRKEWEKYQEKYINELNENSKIGKDLETGKNLKNTNGVIEFGELDETPEINEK